MKRALLVLAFLACMILPSCSDLFAPRNSVVGEWGMVSGGIKKNGKFTSIDKEDSYLKVMEFFEDGTFTETCGELKASGTYTQKGTSISYKYTSVSGDGPEWFVVHRSGTWTYYFWSSDSFTLYDFSSATYEVSMTFERI